MSTSITSDFPQYDEETLVRMGQDYINEDSPFSLHHISSWFPAYKGTTPVIDTAIPHRIITQLTGFNVLHNLHKELPWSLLDSLTVTAVSKSHSAARSGTLWTLWTVEFMGHVRVDGVRHKAYISLCDSPATNDSFFISVLPRQIMN
ncbi:hypothetical protein BDN70DRAFT_901627 [Pholiota conissans]|uniref:Uncharacterized protein n=1 Tax=Pholiota conissans TaxID=109636 RepID=A0A9P5YL28_9AGAR|nr:hypothetical protein BDN70DRAFT_901627 [Pholiota conissans]